MALNGEIMSDPDGHVKCHDCGCLMTFNILESAAGFYLGYSCDCGPYSRESEYYEDRKDLAENLHHGTWKQRQ
jgi:hypothetical protein